MHKIRISVFLVLLFSACSSPSSSTVAQVKQGESSSPDVPVSEVTFYHRLYQGYALPSLEALEFTKTLNTRFFPLFSKAKNVGLIAYRPALPKNPLPCALPGEVALLSFTNEGSYLKYRDTQIGKEIREAHSLVFDGKKSKSLVPTTLTETIHFDHAYYLNAGNHDYRKLHSAVIIHCDPILSGDELRLALVRAYASGSKATDIVFSVSESHVVEYLFFPKAKDAKARIAERDLRFREIFRETSVVRLPRRKILKKRGLAVGRGIDAQ
jgi:hypothetical protein